MPSRKHHNKNPQQKYGKKYQLLFIGFTALFVIICAIYMVNEANKIASDAQTTASGKSLVKKIIRLTDKGGRVDWSAANNRIAFDRMQPDGYYDVYTMNADGTAQVCITCNHTKLPNKHQGQPEWHPSGNWIVFQAEKAKHSGLKTIANPGIGVYNDLWIISADKKSVFQLTNIPNNANSGILHPHFSHNGKKLLWAEMYEKANSNASKKEFGAWKIKIADFVVGNGVPKLSNIQEYQPSGPVWYETHGFSPDGSVIYFTSNSSETQPFQADIFSYAIATKKLVRLTHGGYNEHSQISPDGKRIVWMHTDKVFNLKGTDYWIMNRDGTSKQQLTFFRDKGSASYNKDYIIAADSAWNAKGDAIAAYIQSSITGGKENIVLLRLQ